MGLRKCDATTNYIRQLDDNPNISGMDATTLKAQFDLAGDEIKDYLNNFLTEELDTKFATTSSDIGTLSNLETTTKTDVVSAINEVNGKAADYIIETGTTNGWKWRKWNSGFIELTGFVQHSNITCNIASNGTYYGSGSNGTKIVTLPFTLSSCDFVGYQEQSSRGSGIFVYNASVSGSTLSTEFRNYVSSAGYACGVRYYIRGTI